MTTTPRSIRRLIAMLAGGSVAVMISGCSGGGLVVGDDAAVSSTQPSSRVVTPPASTDSVRIKLRFGDELATATLLGTPAAREFAAMLPLQLDLRDRMGQAKSGLLPRPLDLAGVEPVFDPAVGQLYYWAPSEMFAIFYEDFGHSVPDPGLVGLGAVDTGSDRFVGAGKDFTIRIDLLTTPGEPSTDQNRR